MLDALSYEVKVGIVIVVLIIIWYCYNFIIIENEPDIEELIKPHFNNILKVCNNKVGKHGGSYLMEGSVARKGEYKYAKSMLEKQKLLYNVCKNGKFKNILEIGVYMGHSCLLMLLADPDCHITAVDIDDELSKPATDYLNKMFNNRITFIKSDSLKYLKNCKDKFDFFHIDGQHDDNVIYQELQYAIKLSRKDNIEIIFDDEIKMRPTQEYIKNNYNVLHHYTPECNWASTHFIFNTIKIVK